MSLPRGVEDGPTIRLGGRAIEVGAAKAAFALRAVMVMGRDEDHWLTG